MHPIYGVFFPTREMPQNANFDLFIFKEKKKIRDTGKKILYFSSTFKKFQRIE